MSDEFEEILNDGIIPGEYEPTKFSNPFLNEHATAILEAHAEECCEPIFWLNSEELKFKRTDQPMVSRRLYGIGDSSDERKD